MFLGNPLKPFQGASCASISFGAGFQVEFNSGLTLEGRQYVSQGSVMDDCLFRRLQGFCLKPASNRHGPTENSMSPRCRFSMLGSPELMQLGPPPQEVVDKQWMWKLLMWGFSFVCFLELIAMDVAGAMLTGLLLAFGWLMLRDGMAELPKCASDPLFSELNGRMVREVELSSSPTYVNGTKVDHLQPRH